MTHRPAWGFRNRAFFLFVSAVAAGCAHLPATPTNPAAATSPVINGRALPTPPPRAYVSGNPDHVTIAVVGINDFHGHVMPRERKLPDGRVVKSGGTPVLTSLLKILREEMKGNVLIVDAGDEWQGTLESNQVTGSIVVDYFHRIGLNVATLGNHEFDFGLDTTRKQVGQARYPYVSANIYDRKTGKRFGVESGIANLFPSRLLEVTGIKIGVVGAATQETPRTTRYEVVKGLEFRNPAPILERESRALRKQGAQAVLLTSHAGSRCGKADELQDWRHWTADTAQAPCFEESEINQVLARIKPGTLDGAILGHTHQVVHHWIHGVPAVEDEAFNQFFNILYLTFDRKSGKLLPAETRIEGLVPICAEFFEGVDHCDTRRLPDGYSPAMRPATFHGRTVVPDAETTAWLKPILESTEKYRREVVATAAAPVLHPAAAESMFGNLVADVLREKGKTDFSLVNGRGIRHALEQGPITADALYRALPFDNLLNVLHLKGRDIKLFVRIANSGAFDLASTSGLRVKMYPVSKPAPKVDLNGDGRLEVWETNRIVEITREDGAPIDDDREYTIATFDYLVSGGDNMAWFMSRIPRDRIEPSEAGYCREIVGAYLRQEKVINTPAKPLLRPNRPRLILVE